MSDDKEKIKQRLISLIQEIRQASSADSARKKLNQAFALVNDPELASYVGELLQAYLDNPNVQTEVQGGKVSTPIQIGFNEEQFKKIFDKLDSEIVKVESNIN